MALDESIKKGGRYTKKEQEERKLRVYQYHIVEKKPASYIAEILDVNRNTIRSDIKFLEAHILHKSGGVDLEAMINQTILTKKIQKERLLEDLDESETIDDKIKLEKLITATDNWLVQFFIKALSSKKDKIPSLQKLEIIKESEIEEFVREAILCDVNNGIDCIYSEEKLKLRYLFFSKSNLKRAERFIQEMKNYGLNLCKDSVVFPNKNIDSSKISNDYNLFLFGVQRGYITIEEQLLAQKKQDQIIELREMKRENFKNSKPSF